MEEWASLEVQPSRLLLLMEVVVVVEAEWAVSWAGAASAVASCRWPPLGHQEALELCSITGLVIYSILFCWLLQARISVKKVFFINTQSRFTSVVFDGVLGPPCQVGHTWWCTCFSVVPKATHKARLRALDRCRVSSIRPSRVQDRDEGVAGRNETEEYHPI